MAIGAPGALGVRRWYFGVLKASASDTDGDEYTRMERAAKGVIKDGDMVVSTASSSYLYTVFVCSKCRV